MSHERLEERLDAMLAALRDPPAELDEVAQARVRVRLEDALANPPRAEGANTIRRWRRRWMGAAIGLAATAALVVALVRNQGAAPAAVATGRPPAPNPGSPAANRAAAENMAATETGPPVAVDAADAANYADVGPAVAVAAARPTTSGPATSTPTTSEPATGEPAEAAAGPRAARGARSLGEAPVVVAPGESAQVTVDGANVTVYGPGRLSMRNDGVVADAVSLLVDRTRGDQPWSVRYRGVTVVAMHATFVLDQSRSTRVSVLRGEIVLRCPSGFQTIRSGASGTCEVTAMTQGTALRAPASTSTEAQPLPTRAQLPVQAESPTASSTESSISMKSPTSMKPLISTGSTRATAETRTSAYATAEAAMRRGDLDTAQQGLLAIVAAAPDSLSSATALLDLARIAARRNNTPAALGYLDRLDRHPRRAALAAAAVHLRQTLARTSPAPSLAVPR
jgi:hypothetical protein